MRPEISKTHNLPQTDTEPWDRQGASSVEWAQEDTGTSQQTPLRERTGDSVTEYLPCLLIRSGSDPSIPRSNGTGSLPGPGDGTEGS